MVRIEVEIMGDIQKRLDNDDWEQPVDIILNRRWVVMGDLRISVLDLTYQHSAYLTMGRINKAELLLRWLAANKED